ncbi:hypothetical protein F7731_23730 [Cytobacillus depressus]|uniref:Uncharacterized protein n=1 Tax=Cytobacillus depressus TaxID=1602942 RepID=A0A6L3UY47_9BACI|nr:hypothetical protein [Cytobacillus depressus]KAB2328964.1 hypothetical protein F7731_23730 [Cytobacillus depressus]
MKKWVRFWDLQCNTFSAHTTIEGLADWIIEDLPEEDEEIVERFVKGEMSEQEMREIIESYEYKIVEYQLVDRQPFQKYKGELGKIKLVDMKVKRMRRYFKEIEVLNRNHFKCKGMNGSIMKVVVTDSMFMSVDGKPVCYID